MSPAQEEKTITPTVTNPVAKKIVAPKKKIQSTPKPKPAPKVLGAAAQLPETGTSATDLFVALVGLCLIHSGLTLVRYTSVN